jgi:hypothetical protein
LANKDGYDEEGKCSRKRKNKNNVAGESVGIVEKLAELFEEHAK